MNLKLDPNTWDIIIERRTERVKELAYTTQAVKSRLLTVLGEWEPTPSLGLPWFDQVFIKSPDIPLVQSMIANAINSVEHVKGILQMDVTVDNTTRKLNVSFVAVSDWGDIENNITLGV